MSAIELQKSVLKNSANLKAYYRMESGALTTDSSGNNNSLTDAGTVTVGTGVFGGAADFGANNSTKYFFRTDSVGISLSSSFSVSFWIKLQSEIGSGVWTIFDILDSTKRYICYYDYNGGTRRLGVFVNGGTDITYNVTLGTSAWNLITFAYNGSTTTLFFNGARVGSSTSGTGTAALTPRTSIAANKDNGGLTSALIDDLSVFQMSLSADQIKELYEGRTVGEGWPQAGLVAGYHLNGNSTDFSGNNNHGTDTAVTYSQANGKFGQGAGIGASSVIDIGNVSTLNFERTSPLTIAGWIKPSAGLTYPEIICKQTSGGSYQGWGFFLNSASNYVLSFEETNTNLTNQLSVAGSILIPTDKFTYVVATYDGSSTVGGIKLYINGSLDGTINIKANNLSSTIQQTNTVKIGRRASSDGQFQGAIDELTVYNVAKDASWVRKQYALGMGRFY